MDALHGVLGLVAMLAAALAVWLALARQRVAIAWQAEQDLRARAQADAAAALAAGQEELRQSNTQREQLRAALDHLRTEHAELLAELAGARESANGAIELHRAELARVREVADERLKAAELARATAQREFESRLTQLRDQMRDTFQSLAGQTLRSAAEEFQKRAREEHALASQKASSELDARRTAIDQLVKPLSDAIQRTQASLEAFERKRAESFGSVNEQLRGVIEASAAQRSETAKLAKALGKPQVRGRYGEIQLERVVELAGMKNYCDFTTQTTLRDGDDRLFRPDMIVRLPNERSLVIDAKTPIDAYVEALGIDNPAEQEALLERFADNVVEQVKRLSEKSYSSLPGLARSPEFVVMFIAGDQYIDAALSRRPDLLELAAQKRVVLASPSTLIGLLRAVEAGWREQRLADEAQELRRLGAELHKRGGIMLEKVARLGDSLSRSVREYNEFVGSFQGRFVPHLEKFSTCSEGAERALPELSSVSIEPRTVRTSQALLLPDLSDDGEAPARTSVAGGGANGKA
ncbi:MAG: DNA recombination protein RmuC [Planctomycetota bacterium]|nr:DNA recombination protein RmuC [Planctomycetota bacterium]